MDEEYQKLQKELIKPEGVTEKVDKQLHELSKKVKAIFEHQVIVEEIIEEEA